MPPVKRQISPHASKLCREGTDAEKLLWLRLRDRRLDGWKFRRQHSIGSSIVDFVCLERRLIVEADGGHHKAKKDAPRTGFLRHRDFRVIRYWNNDILESTDGVLASILEALERR